MHLSLIPAGEFPHSDLHISIVYDIHSSRSIKQFYFYTDIVVFITTVSRELRSQEDVNLHYRSLHLPMSGIMGRALYNRERESH